MTSAELIAVADTLYAGPAAGFTAARDAAAKEADTPELARQIKALRKPSTAAWAINLLVRREADQIDQVLDLAASLRAAAESMDGDGLRTLTRQRRQLTAALTTSAAQLVREFGVRLTPAVADQVEGVLTAAMLDPDAAAVVRTGLVLTAFTSTGVSAVDPATLCAVPASLGHRATATERPAPVLQVVPDGGVRRQAAEEQVEEAAEEHARATEGLEHLRARNENLNARRLQLQGEIDELRRRLAGIESEVDALDEEIEETLDEVEDATAAVDVAAAALAEARRNLARLRD